MTRPRAVSSARLRDWRPRQYPDGGRLVGQFRVRVDSQRQADVAVSGQCVGDLGVEVADEVLLARAGELQRVLVSQDVDLLRIARQWQSEGRPFPGLICAHQHGMSIGQCTADLELIAACCEEGELANQVLFLPLT